MSSSEVSWPTKASLSSTELSAMIGAMALLLFILLAGAAAVLWNRFFTSVPARIVVLFGLIVVGYQAETFFSSRVDLPGNLAFVTYPWKALARPAADANTGIIFTQIAPWTEIARRSIAAAEAPLWNRHSGAGAPLLANQQTAILHPFTVVGLILPLGQAFTLSVALRLFFSLFFLYVFLRNWDLHPLASIFGSVAYTFCTFNIVWLLFPLGLATAGVVPGLAATDEYFRRPRRRSFVLLVLALALPILGGHPESAFWVGFTLAGYGLYALVRVTTHHRLRVGAGALAAAAAAMALTAVWWMPTLEILPHTSRYGLMQSHGKTAAPELPSAWMTTLFAPNILGTPQDGTYQPPQPRYPTLLDDYGELASGYAGVIALGLAIAAIFARRKPAGFFGATALFAFLTVTQTPYWYPFIRSVPIVDLTLDQRLRFLWALSIAVLAALALDALLSRRLRCGYAIAGLLLAGATSTALYVHPLAVTHPHAWVAGGVVLAATAFITFAPLRSAVVVLVLLSFGDLSFTTRNYNPSSRPRDVYPKTGAIAAMQSSDIPGRMVALGWSFLAETPGFYGLEDVKTTDPISNPDYLRLLVGYLRIEGGDYDQVVGDVTLPFFDFLNIAHVYVPPDHALPDDPALHLIYSGEDGSVLLNSEVLPRYFFVDDFIYEPSFDVSVARSKGISDFRRTAVVDQLVPVFGTIQPGDQITSGRGQLALQSYGSQSSRIFVDTAEWSLLVSSDPFWPGWEATLDGRPLPIVKVNGAFLGVFVPPGSGLLHLEYRPRAYVRGRAISLLTAALLICFTAAPALLARRSRSDTIEEQALVQ